MNKFILTCFVYAFYLSSLAMADPIFLRSGDHDGFTRLVLQLPPNVQWEVSSIPGKQSISFRGHDDGFDIRGVFEIIQRDRLINIQTFPSRLELELNCNCKVEYFVEFNKYLVIDIMDSPLFLPNEIGKSTNLKQLEIHSNFGFGELMWIAPEPKPVSRYSEEDLSEGADQKASDEASLAAASVAEQTRKRLLEGVANAASRGLIQPQLPEENIQPTTQQAPQTVDIYDSSGQEVFDLNTQLGNLRVTSSRDSPQNSGNIGLTASGTVCPDPGVIQVTNWGDEGPFHEQTSKLREKLYTELDRLDEQTVLELARLYIYFGFGLEAKQTLRLSKNLETLHPEILDLADIVDFGFARNPRIIHRYLGCNSDGSFWAVLAARTISPNKMINEKAALRGLSKLPPHLRDYLAPKLSERFTGLEKFVSASIALRQIDPNGETGDTDSEIAKAIIDNSAGRTSSADLVFSEISLADSSDAPKALISYIENRLINLDAVGEDVSLLIDAYAFEFRNSALSSQLERAQILSSALSGQFDKAIKLTNLLKSNHEEEPISEILPHVLSVLANSASDIDFLDIVFRELPADRKEISPEVIFVVAERLLALGFPEFAQEWLDGAPKENWDSRFLELRANIFLELNQPQAALKFIESAFGGRVNEIKARAHLALGQNDVATDLFEAAGLVEQAQRSAWLSDQGVSLRQAQTAPLNKVQELTNRTISNVPKNNSMLSETVSALEESANARNALGIALKELEISD
ncbi:hypothetical protein ROLI_038660 [Roseobacter fucihabitans]|uniref:Uncharacterized protein n=1 Tax=Roseobacter fucihabitans TaxID=1537242 RepID=A0ABZ2BY87_9RHOB|nr:hypothetical protein [Roseobacter litoralis]MBC6967312.1 hypothetical protein [Roseobacter litoralis]